MNVFNLGNLSWQNIQHRMLVNDSLDTRRPQFIFTYIKSLLLNSFCIFPSQNWNAIQLKIWVFTPFFSFCLVHYRQKTSMDEALYEVKWVFSSDFFLLCKSTATLLPTRYVLANNETFQMRYCTKFYLKKCLLD